MRHILFLDIDGVLNIQSNSYTTAMQRNNLIEPHLVQRLNYLLDKTFDVNLEVVISSSWRNDMEALHRELNEAGFRHKPRIVGRTTLNPNITKRGEQIHRWLKENIDTSYMPRIDCTIQILDDEIHDIEPFFERSSIIKTEADVGVTNFDIMSIIDALNRTEKSF